VRALRPRVVVAIDGEENLFRLTDLYHTRRRYSWVDPEPSTVNMARPLGAFLFFPKAEPGPEQGSAIFGRYGLTLESFRLREEDSFARLADLPESARSLLRETHACLACHRLRGVGGRAGHIRATDAVLMGGHALPLERYPRVVWKRFIFDQAAVAEEVGADAVVFEPEEAQLLFDLVERERSARQIESWVYPDRQRD